MAIAVFSHTFTTDINQPQTITIGTLPSNAKIVDVIAHSPNLDYSEMGQFSIGHDGFNLVPANTSAFIANITQFGGTGPFRTGIDALAAPICETVPALDITLTITSATTNANGTTINVIIHYV